MPDSLTRARALTRLLDTAIRVPGTSVRLGLDPLLGIIPGLGDVSGAVLSGYLILLASRAGAPRTTIVRMVMNVAIDTVGGTVPVIGDLFDVAYKSNTRNLALLEGHLGVPSMGVAEPAASRRVVWGSLLLLALLAIGGIVLAWFVVMLIFHRMQ